MHNKKFTIFHQNVCSLGTSINILDSTIKCNEYIQIVCISEHWKSKDQLINFGLGDFNIKAQFCRDEGEHGGVVIYVRKSLDARERADISKMSVKGICELAAIEYKINGRKHICIAVYNDGTSETILNILDEIISNIKNCYITIVGDFNINMMENSPKKCELLQFFNCYNIQQTIFSPTRITATSSTCIDGIFTNLDIPFSTGTWETHISDHCAQYLTYSEVKSNPQYTLKRLYTKENVEKLRHSLNTQDWTSIYNDCEDVNITFNKFHSLYIQHLNATCPLRKLPKKKFKDIIKENPSVVEIKKKLDILLVMCQRDPSYRCAYIKVKKQYDKELISQKVYLYEKRITASDNKVKTMWSMVKSIKNTTSKRDFPVAINPKYTANELNKYLINVAPNLTEHLPFNDSDILETDELDKSMYVRSITTDELRDIVSNLKNKYTHGMDGISSNLLKQTFAEIEEPLRYMVNQSLRHGVFPDKLKEAIVIPIFKQGDSSDFGNYRPISILPSFSKIFEMAYCRQLLDFMISNNIFAESQHGYLKGKSVHTAIYDFIKKVLDAFESRKLAMGLFLDLSKAYDSVNVERLIGRLFKYGVRGPVLAWVRSYFRNRSQVVEIEMNGERVRSEIMNIKLGLAQGSIVGPIMFIIYINELENMIKDRLNEGLVVNYVDDTNILTLGQQWPELKEVTSEVLRQACLWFSVNNLILNKDKTKIILFQHTNARTESPNTIQLNEDQYNIIHSAKFLGVHIDSDLNWRCHIDNLSKKVSSSIYGLRIVSNYLNLQSLKAVYYATIEAKLRFGIIFYGSGNIQSIFVLQKRAIRLMYGLTRIQSCRGVFKDNNLLTVYAIYIQECLIFQHKNKNLFSQHINRKKSNYNIRNFNYTYPKHDLTSTEKQVEYRCLRLFNSLPSKLQMETDLKKFKKDINKYLIQMEPYRLDDFMK